MAKVYQGEIGLRLEITITGVDLTGTTVTYNVLGPYGAEFIMPATIESTATGLTSFTVTEQVGFSLPGRYQLQPKIISGGNVFYAEPVTLEIFPLYG